MVTVCSDTVALPSVSPTPIRACGLNVYLSEDDVLQEYDNDIGDCSEASVHTKSKDDIHKHIDNNYTNDIDNNYTNDIDNNYTNNIDNNYTNNIDYTENTTNNTTNNAKTFLHKIFKNSCIFQNNSIHLP